jgi:RNA polymerase sigma-70 factor (ECF subfamily)
MDIAATIPMPNMIRFETGGSASFGLNYLLMPKGLTDQELKELIIQCRQGDLLAMESLYERFKGPLFTLALRYTYNFAAAEDVIQDVFVKVFTNLHTLDEDKAFVSWLYRIAVNTSLSYLRSHKKLKQKTIPLDEVQAFVADSQPPATQRAESFLPN